MEAKACFSYIRFSSRKQSKAKGGNSEDRQLPIAPRIAKAKGWTLREDLNLKDLGVSAFRGDNIKTLRAIIDAAKSGKIPQGTVMIIEAFDRAWRVEVDPAYQIFRELLIAGVEIYTDRSSRHLTKADLNNPMSIMMTVSELAAAHEYAAKLSERVGSAWRRKKTRAADGVLMTTMTPAWLIAHRDTNTWEINEPHANTVRRMFNLYAEGKGVRTIMKMFNDPNNKVAAFGKGKQNVHGTWSSTHIRRTLAERAVIGEYQPCVYDGRKRKADGDPITNYYPAVIEPALFYKVQEMLPKVTGKQLNDKGKLVSIFDGTLGRGPKGNVTNLFTGLVKCTCGSSMVIKRSGCKYNYVSLVCYNATRGTGCKYSTILYNQVERAVLTLMFSKVLPAMSQSDKRKDDLLTLKGELKEAQKQKAKWVKIIESSDTVPDVASQKLNYYDTQEKVKARQIEALEATIHDNPLAEWQQVDKTPENRLRLQSILAKHITALTVNASERKATLTVDETVFEMSWPSGIGANQLKSSPANHMFYVNIEGNETPFAYLDNMMVWKNSKETILKELSEVESLGITHTGIVMANE